MKASFALTCLGGLAAGMAITWAWPARTSSANPVKRGEHNRVVRPAKLASSASSPLLKAWKEATANQGGFGGRIGLMAIVMRASSEEMPLLLAGSKDNAFARELLILRWVEIDAAAAGDWISPALRDPNASGHEANGKDVLRVLNAWAKRDPDAALAKLKAEGGDFTVTQYQSQIIGSALAEDMERGLKLMAETKGRANSMYFDSAWVKKDPAKAARLLSEMPESEFRNDSLVRAMGELGAKDMAAGLALLEKFPGLSSMRQQYSSAITDSRAALFEQWAKRDMTAMIGFVNDHAQGATRSAMKEAIAKVIGEGDPKVAFAWAADNLSGQRRNSVVNSLLTKLAKEKPAEALEYVTSLPPGTALQSAVSTFAKATSAEDPATALARVQSLPESAARTQLLAASYLAWYGKDPATALSEIASQPADALPKDLWGSLGRSSRSIELGLKQIDQIPAALAPEFVRGVFMSPATYNADISQTLKGIEQVREPAQRAAAIESVVSNWAYRDPTAVAEWAAKLSSADERKRVLTLLEPTSLGRLSVEDREKLLAPLR